jgi:hypothetical protein
VPDKIFNGTGLTKFSQICIWLKVLKHLGGECDIHPKSWHFNPKSRFHPKSFVPKAGLRRKLIQVVDKRNESGTDFLRIFLNYFVTAAVAFSWSMLFHFEMKHFLKNEIDLFFFCVGSFFRVLEKFNLKLFYCKIKDCNAKLLFIHIFINDLNEACKFCLK